MTKPDHRKPGPRGAETYWREGELAGTISVLREKVNTNIAAARRAATAEGWRLLVSEPEPGYVSLHFEAR